MSQPAGASTAASLLELAGRLKAQRKVSNTRCPAARVIAHMKPGEVSDLEALMRLNRYEMPTSVIHEALKAMGYDINDNALGNHRRRMNGGNGCQCPTS